MKIRITILTALTLLLSLTGLQAQTKQNKFFIDVHLLKPGSVTAADVVNAHAKDLAVQAKYGVSFLEYWVDEKGGTIYCLSTAPDSAHIADAHNEAHGLQPQQVYEVTGGTPAAVIPGVPFYLDIHNIGVGNVTAEAVAKAHKKDLAVQKKHGVSCFNYWVCESKGLVFCLCQTKDGANVLATHKEAHGLMPDVVVPVIRGQ